MYIFQEWLTFKGPEAKCLANQYFMSHDIQAPQDASAETQEILKELQSEGHDVAGLEKEDPKETPKADPQLVKEEEEKPEVKPEEKTEEKESEKKPDSTEQPKVDRATKAVPVGKYNDERHKRQEAEKRAEEAEKRARELEEKANSNSNKPTQQETDDVREAAKKIAEKHGYDSEFIGEFADTIVALASKRNVLPQEIEAKLKAFDEMKAAQDARTLEQAQETGFNNEFESVIKEFPELASHKEDIKQLAFVEGNNGTALRKIAIEYMHDNPITPNITAEKRLNGRVDIGDAIDFSTLTEDQFNSLTDEQMDKYLAWIEKNPKRK